MDQLLMQYQTSYSVPPIVATRAQRFSAHIQQAQQQREQAQGSQAATMQGLEGAVQWAAPPDLSGLGPFGSQAISSMSAADAGHTLKGVGE